MPLAGSYMRALVLVSENPDSIPNITLKDPPASQWHDLYLCQGQGTRM
jgi:hypothetical protein